MSSRWRGTDPEIAQLRTDIKDLHFRMLDIRRDITSIRHQIAGLDQQYLFLHGLVGKGLETEKDSFKRGYDEGYNKRKSEEPDPEPPTPVPDETVLYENDDLVFKVRKAVGMRQRSRPDYVAVQMDWKDPKMAARVPGFSAAMRFADAYVAGQRLSAFIMAITSQKEEEE